MMRHEMKRALVAGILAAWLGGCGGEPQPDGTTDAEPRPVVTAGQQVYRNYCLSCHQADGNGVPGMYPPLTESEWVTGDKGRLIRLVLNGMQGPVEVRGERYDNVMAPHGHLKDQQIADVLTFVRSHFGNEADAVTPQEVATVRAANTQQGLWDAAVLEQETGIPSTE